MVVLPGFEPRSPAPKASMIDHYTTGLLFGRINARIYQKRLPTRYVAKLPVTSAFMKVPSSSFSFMAIGR